MEKKILEIKNLSIKKKNTNLISNSNFKVKNKEVVGLFGDSGSGKSIFSFFLLGFLNKQVFSFSADSARFMGSGGSFDLLSKNDADWSFFRKNRVSMIFQDPSTALNPTIVCGEQIRESCFFLNKKASRSFCFDLLKNVGIKFPEKVYHSFPHQLSGGQKQRVVIAIAIASSPNLLIADEPTTSLDPSTQRSVLDLVLSLRARFNIGVVLISHNLDLIRYYCDRVYFFKNKSFVSVLNTDKKKHLFDLDFILKKIKKKEHPEFSSLMVSFFKKKNLFIRQKKTLCVFEFKKLSVSFVKKGVSFFALKNISFKVFGGDCLGVVGGSGSGKTTLGRVVSGLHKKYTGRFDCFEGDVFLKQKVQLVYQDPFSSFNPKYTVGNSVSEIIKLYKTNYTVSELFEIVSLKKDYINRYPHELSGGQKQRVSIARVLASNPSVIVFDESLSALDIKTQYSILELVRFINRFLGITVVFISHDINSVYYLCNNIIVLNSGEVVDFFKGSDLFFKNRKEYTKRLILDSNFL